VCPSTTNDVSVPACQNDGSTRGIQIQAGNFLEIPGELFIFSDTKGHGVNLWGFFTLSGCGIPPKFHMEPLAHKSPILIMGS
jgi:hypothetical protein